MEVWWKSGTVLEEQWNSDSGTVGWKVEQLWLNSVTVLVKECGGTVEQ